MMKKILITVTLCLGMGVPGFWVLAGPVESVSPDEKCAVCGMMVAKYNPWITQIHASGQAVVMFDGVKDMMAYYFNPEAYGGKGDMQGAEVWVKDYYTLEYIDARTAFYVLGSDVMGPMGAELVPFGSRKAAETFNKDHKGAQLMEFDEIESELILSMKEMHMIKKKKMKGSNP